MTNVYDSDLDPLKLRSGNARDFVWRNLRDDADRAAVTAPFVADSDGLRATFPIVVAA